MHCPNCGFQMEDESLFCGNCGVKLDQFEKPAETQPEYVPQVVNELSENPEHMYETPEPEEPSEPTSAYDFQEQELSAFTEPQQPEKKKKRWLLILMLALAGLILIGGILVALDYFQVLNLGLFGKSYAVVQELISYDAEDHEVKYMRVKLNDEGLPGTIEIEDGDKFTIQLNYTGTDISSAVVEGEISHYETSAYIEFNEYGNKIKMTADIGGEEHTASYEYKYDDAGNKLKETYFEDGEKLYIYTYKYDEYGSVIYEKYDDREDSDNDSITTYEYEYDSAGNVVYMYCEVDGYQAYTAEFDYNSDGQILWSEYEYANYFETTNYEYRNGNLITKTIFHNTDEEYRYEYEYDENGNMSKETVFFEDDLEGYTEYYWFYYSKRISDITSKVLSKLEILK